MLTTGSVNKMPWIWLISFSSEFTAARISGTSGILVIGFGSRPAGTSDGAAAGLKVVVLVVPWPLWISCCSGLEIAPVTLPDRVVLGAEFETFGWSAEVKLGREVSWSDIWSRFCW